MSGYSVTAQYYDPLMAAAHAEVDAQIVAGLQTLDTRGGPVVDIGAGTGLSTTLIATTLPDAEVLAVEPDASMRSALMARVWGNEDLRARVSILPSNVFSAPLPDTISGALLSASLVHFSPEERLKLWTLLADKLCPRGRVILEIQCPEAIDIPSFDMAEVKVGRITYTAKATAYRTAPDRQRWTMIYRAVVDNHELVCDTTSYECWTASPQTILAEGSQAGFNGRVVDDLVILEQTKNPKRHR